MMLILRKRIAAWLDGGALKQEMDDNRRLFNKNQSLLTQLVQARDINNARLESGDCEPLTCDGDEATIATSDAKRDKDDEKGWVRH